MSKKAREAWGDSVSETITVRIPMPFRRRGGRWLMIVPSGVSTLDPTRAPAPGPVLKALIRAYRWRRLFESGEFASIAELAAAEKIDKSYLSKVLRLTTLAPETVESIVDQYEHFDVALERLLSPFPTQWDQQQKFWQNSEAY